MLFLSRRISKKSKGGKKQWKPLSDGAITILFGGVHRGHFEDEGVTLIDWDSPNYKQTHLTSAALRKKLKKPIPRTSKALRRMIKRWRLTPSQIKEFWEDHRKRVAESERDSGIDF